MFDVSSEKMGLCWDLFEWSFRGPFVAGETLGFSISISFVEVGKMIEVDRSSVTMLGIADAFEGLVTDTADFRSPNCQSHLASIASELKSYS